MGDHASSDGLSEFVRKIRERYSACISAELVQPANEGCYEDFPEELDDRLLEALRSKGIERLYRHQRLAWDHIQGGKHTVLVTPTASGKTLCYNLPVLSAVLRDKAKALYLFPTKALSQDQVAEIMELNRAADLGVRAYTFDGDTPGDARKAVRVHGDIVVSNPDMLHQGILPHHTKWAQFFENLRYIIIDEMHIYRGVFGSHVANVLRRLQRICRFYGSSPQFILCSATIANPGELAAKLIGDELVTIDESGAPRGERRVMLWNPPVINADLGIRASARSQSTRIARLATKLGLKNIIFAQSRLMVEVITKYLKDTFDKDPRRPSRVYAYRGGYLPSERRKTEKRMREGQIDSIVSTSALELGVDIGALDVCVLNGYPGSIAASWQRLGRAGRRNRPSLGVLVANSLPLDQFIMRNPAFFLEASPEHAQIDADQLLILLDHIRCAAFELPFRDGDRFGGQAPEEFLEYLEDEGVLHHEGDQWHWMTDAYPANSVSLRSVAEGNFVVIDVSDGKQEVIAEVDYSAAPMTLYEGAIYMIQAQPWQVERLDWEGRKAFVTRTQADYYTDAIDYTKLKILEQFECIEDQGRRVAMGEVHLVRRVAGYKKIRYYTHDNVGFGKVNLPDHEMHTTAVWWQLASQLLDLAFDNRWQALDGFLGAAYAMHQVASIVLMSQSQDIGRAVGNADSQWIATVGANGRGRIGSFSGEDASHDIHSPQFSPTVFLYDNFPGGIGLSAPLFDKRRLILTQALQMVNSCDCLYGCPSCVGAILASDQERGYSPKQAAYTVLSLFDGDACTLETPPVMTEQRGVVVLDS